jgi:hypothetical protein
MEHVSGHLSPQYVLILLGRTGLSAKIGGFQPAGMADFGQTGILILWAPAPWIPRACGSFEPMHNTARRAELLSPGARALGGLEEDDERRRCGTEFYSRSPLRYARAYGSAAHVTRRKDVLRFDRA